MTVATLLHLPARCEDIGHGRVRVHLTETERWKLKRLALEREWSHSDIRDPKIERKRAGWEIHFDGTRAEYAVARVLGIPFDTCTDLDRDLKRLDMLLPDGSSLHVKSTPYPVGRLLFHHRFAPFTTEYAALVVVPSTEAPAVDIIGFIERDEFFRVCHEAVLKVGPQPAVHQEQLHPILELRRMTEAEPPCAGLCGCACCLAHER